MKLAYYICKVVPVLAIQVMIELQPLLSATVHFPESGCLIGI